MSESRSRSHVVFQMQESLREEWADLMLLALKENGHVYLSNDEYHNLKEKIMQLLIAQVRI